MNLNDWEFRKWIYPFFIETRKFFVDLGAFQMKAENKINIHHLFTMAAGLNYAVNTDEIKKGKIETEGKCPTIYDAIYRVNAT